jgi:hypothetical protein
MTDVRFAVAISLDREHESPILLNRALLLLKKVLVNFLDLKGVFNPAPDVVADHEFG